AYALGADYGDTPTFLATRGAAARTIGSGAAASGSVSEVLGVALEPIPGVPIGSWNLTKEAAVGRVAVAGVVPCLVWVPVEGYPCADIVYVSGSALPYNEGATNPPYTCRNGRL